jgi:hypothetical protein
LTADNLYDEETLKSIEQGAAELVSLVDKHAVPNDTDIVLSLGWADGGYAIAYYLASMSRQCVFWMEKVPTETVTLSDRVAVSQTHLSKSINFKS